MANKNSFFQRCEGENGDYEFSKEFSSFFLYHKHPEYCHKLLDMLECRNFQENGLDLGYKESVLNSGRRRKRRRDLKVT